MTIKILNKSDYNTTAWSGGETTELYIYPENSNLKERDFIFRISSATCPDETSKFSDFTGFNRYITSLDKDLILTNQGEEHILKPYEIFFFDGADDTASHSAVRDFNLIIKKGITGSLRSESVQDSVKFRIPSGINLITSPSTSVTFIHNDEEIILQPFEALLIYGENEEIVLKTIDNIYAKLIIVEVEVW